MTGAPTGHTFRIGRTRIEHGWRLTATCACKHAVTADNYGDLSGLVNDHYAEVRLAREIEKKERAHT
ncbi:MAG: hypothetical protein HIU88_10170 [Acidobacteria bacterium]|nr:hypothetical protein [Acidobacteriota bacterium]